MNAARNNKRRLLREVEATEKERQKFPSSIDDSSTDKTEVDRLDDKIIELTRELREASEALGILDTEASKILIKAGKPLAEQKTVLMSQIANRLEKARLARETHSENNSLLMERLRGIILNMEVLLQSIHDNSVPGHGEMGKVYETVHPQVIYQSKAARTRIQKSKLHHFHVQTVSKKRAPSSAPSGSGTKAKRRKTGTDADESKQSKDRSPIAALEEQPETETSGNQDGEALEEQPEAETSGNQDDEEATKPHQDKESREQSVQAQNDENNTVTKLKAKLAQAQTHNNGLSTEVYKLRNDLSTAQKSIQQLSEHAKSPHDSHEIQTDMFMEERRKLLGEIQDLEKKVKNLEEEGFANKLSLKSNYLSIEQMDRQIQELEMELEGFQEDMTDADSDASEIGDLLPRETTCRELRSEVKKLQSDLQEKEDSFLTLQEEHKKATDKLAIIGFEKVKLHAISRREQVKIRELQDRINIMDDILDELRGSDLQDALAQSQLKCKALQDGQSGLQTQLANSQAQLTASLTLRNDLQAELSTSRSECLVLKTNRDNLQLELDEARSQRDDFHTQHNSMKARNSCLQRGNNSLLEKLEAERVARRQAEKDTRTERPDHRKTQPAMQPGNIGRSTVTSTSGRVPPSSFLMSRSLKPIRSTRPTNPPPQFPSEVGPEDREKYQERYQERLSEMLPEDRNTAMAFTASMWNMKIPGYFEKAINDTYMVERVCDETPQKLNEQEFAEFED